MHVQKLRLKKGWSQQQLADFSGLSVRTVQRIEAGQPASTETLKSLAAVFEVDFASLNPEPSMTATPPSTPSAPATPSDSTEREEQEAFRHVRKLRGFYAHLSKYALVIPALWLINWYASPHTLWAVWPTLGWGLGIVMHGLGVFKPSAFLGPQWERREVEKRLGRPL
jgi:transcriptional regulator with XRE-family HTH domain